MCFELQSIFMIKKQILLIRGFESRPATTQGRSAMDFTITLTTIIDDDDCFYIALSSAVEQTHCARM